MQFFYSVDGSNFSPLGSKMAFRQGKWIGARVGVFAVGNTRKNDVGYADFDWFRVEPISK
jgi:hypothetical protein